MTIKLAMWTHKLFFKETTTISLSFRLNPTEAKTAIDSVYKMLTNEHGYPPEARRAAGERVCLPLLRSCDLAALREFFLDHIGEIMQVLEANLTKVSRDISKYCMSCDYLTTPPQTGMELQLVLKLCCFQLMEVLYSRISSTALSNPENSIIKAFCRQPKTGKELTQAITK